MLLASVVVLLAGAAGRGGGAPGAVAAQLGPEGLGGGAGVGLEPAAHVEVEHAEVGGAGGAEQAREQGLAASGGEAAEAAGGEAFAAVAGGGGEADPGEGAPGDGAGDPALAAALLGERVHEGVGGGVVGLAG